MSSSNFCGASWVTLQELCVYVFLNKHLSCDGLVASTTHFCLRVCRSTPFVLFLRICKPRHFLSANWFENAHGWSCCEKNWFEQRKQFQGPWKWTIACIDLLNLVRQLDPRNFMTSSGLLCLRCWRLATFLFLVSLLASCSPPAPHE